MWQLLGGGEVNGSGVSLVVRRWGNSADCDNEGCCRVENCVGCGNRSCSDGRNSAVGFSGNAAVGKTVLDVAMGMRHWRKQCWKCNEGAPVMEKVLDVAVGIHGCGKQWQTSQWESRAWGNNAGGFNGRAGTGKSAGYGNGSSVV